MMNNDIRSTNAAVRNTQPEWLKTHEAMVAHPPRDGRAFLRHARSLIGLLEGASEAHPFAKAIVTTFKGVIMYELDRRENEARVTTVVVAQTEMMRILLDLDELNKRRGGTFATESDSNILADDLYSDLMNRIRTNIKEYSNTIDTYYKEKRRIVKFFRANEWKLCMDYVKTFYNHRLSLQQTLHIQVASSLEDAKTKLDRILQIVDECFKRKYDWKKKVKGEMRKYRPPSLCKKDSTVLAQLIKISNKQGDQKDKNQTEAPDAATRKDWDASSLNNIQRDLQISLKDLCSDNWSFFQSRLDLHSKNLEDSLKQTGENY